MFSTVKEKNWSVEENSKLSLRLTYMFSYNLFQFCCHTWILANTIARFLTFGRDALADTFHSVGFVMSLCQLLTILELFHIADGIEKAKLLPRFVQVLEKNLLLILIIVLEEIQSKPAVCLVFFFWNIQDLLRYPHELLCTLNSPFVATLWARYTLWIPVYVASVATEGVTMYQALLHVDPNGPYSHLHLPSVLMAFSPLLAVGAAVAVWQLLKERQQHLDRWSKKLKRK
ncbi:very-long-chain (3R)-3-hydroxyacyl-CoA dehydratase 4 [Thalassophryne amazonica]|uniref:very-long-chain (3R)-3-hydroxyacyl-CoA dehydratase 4 n=1 Tax=Thalassophryne amazonica TaxID=390379 RepID=UPI001471DAB9|nr:very-long-chain (3R)-3-hydroxyacyl-CoA dehydratase 4 [Thalassophryne amazonica]